MDTGLAAQIGLRYVLSPDVAIARAARLAAFGLGLSIAILLLVLSVVNGFDREMRERLLSVLPQVIVMAREPVPVSEADVHLASSTPGVAGVSPIVQGAGLLATDTRTHGVMITGIAPETYGAVSDLGHYTSHSLERLTPDGFDVFLGHRLASLLDLDVGDHATLVLPAATVTVAGVFPRQKRVHVAGIAKSDSEVDARAVFMHRTPAAKLFRLGERIHGYQVRVDDLFSAEAIASDTARRLNESETRPRFRATSWQRTHGNLYQAIATQKTTMFLLLSLLVAVAAFNLVSTCIMVVNQRAGDVAILQTLGARFKTYGVAVALFGLLLGCAGIAAGLVFGVFLSWAVPRAFAWASETFTLDLMSQYFVTYLPVDVQWADIATILLVSLVLIVAATLYPAWRASRLRPSVVLAHE